MGGIQMMCSTLDCSVANDGLRQGGLNFNKFAQSFLQVTCTLLRRNDFLHPKAGWVMVNSDSLDTLFSQRAGNKELGGVQSNFLFAWFKQRKVVLLSVTG